MAVRQPQDAWLFEFMPDDLSSGSPVATAVRVSTHGFETDADTAIPADLRDKPWPKAVRPDITYSVTLPEGLFGVARTRFGSVMIWNPSVKDTADGSWTGERDELRDYAWAGRDFRAWRSPDGRSSEWSYYTETYVGIIERMIPRTHGYEVLISDNASRLEQPLGLPKYMGLNRALSVTTSSSSNHGDVLDLTDEFTLEFLVRFSAGDLTQQNQRVFDKLVSSVGWRLEINQNGNGSMRFTHEDLTTTTAPNGTFTEDEIWHRVSFVWEPAGISPGRTVIYLDGENIKETSQSFTAPLTTNANSLILIANCTAEFSDLRIWSEAMTQEKIRANMHRRIPGTTTNLVGYWYNLNEPTNSLLLDETSGGNDGTATSITPIDSGEGPSDLTGHFKPLTVGGGSNYVAGNLLAVADRVFAYGSGPHVAAPAVYDAGKALDEGTGGGTNFTVDYARGIVTIHTLFSSDLGQIRITAPGFDDGTDDPETFAEIVEWLLTTYGPFVAADLDTTITSHSSTKILEYHFPGGEDAPIISEVLRRICAAVGTAIVPLASGKLGALNLSAPTVYSATTLTDDDFVELEIEDLEEPTSAQRVGYARTYAPQDLSELDSSNAETGVIEALRDPWRVAEDPAALTLLDRWPEAQPGDLVETALRTEADALALANTLQDSYWGVEAGVMTIKATLATDAPDIRIGDVVLLKSAILRMTPGGLLFICRSHDLRRRITLFGGFEP